MTKTRVIPVLLWDETGLVKPRAFERPMRKVGSLMQAIKVYDRRNVDELILLDISSKRPRCEVVKQFTEQLFCPVTVGGGVATLNDIEQLLRAGADKVSICSHAAPSFIEKAAKRFGSQAIVAAIDYKTVHTAAGSMQSVFTQNGTHNTFLHPAAWSIQLAEYGAGEILLTSIDRDGMMTGYDIEMINQVAFSIAIPLIANGGCRAAPDMAHAIQAGAHAAAASSIFLFTSITPNQCKDALEQADIPVRRDP